MDISKLINDSKISNMSLREYKKEMYGSWVSERKPIQEAHKIRFSCETDRYFEIIQKYVRDERSFDRAIHGINKFIDSCLLMGELLYKAKGQRIPIRSYKCGSEVNLSSTLCPTQYTGNRERPRFLHIAVRLQATSDNEVHILISESDNSNDYNNREFLCSQSYCVDHRLQGMNIRPARDGSTYMIMNERFNPPPYDNLPLYINAPFLNEYARYMFENPPSPLSTFRMPSNFF